MELLYLYIEEFKSINKQEYLFTPDYDISYNSKKLEINKIDSGLPKNFFGERIGNIHSIIGENGSGKSSLLEFIVSHTSNSAFAWKDMAIFVFRNEEKLHILKHWKVPLSGMKELEKKHSIHIYNEGSFKKGGNPLIDLYTVYYSNYYDAELKMFQDQQLENLVDISTNYIQRLRERFDYSYYRQDDEDSDNSESEKTVKHSEGYSFRAFEVDKQINLISQRNLSEILDFSIPDTIEISVYPHHDARQMIAQFKKDGYYTPELDSTLEKFDALFDDTTLHKFFKAIFYCKSLSIVRRTMAKVSYPSVISRIQNSIDKTKSEFDIDKLMDGFSNATDKTNLRILISQLRNLEKYANHGGTYNIPTTSNEDLKSASKLNGASNRAFFGSDNPIKFDWFFNNSNRKGGLSSGEKAMLSFYARIHYAQNHYFVYDTLFVIDEGDLGLHPEWQRTFIQKLVVQGSMIARPGTPAGSPIQILITSHSPFLASDLPDSNITYLKRNKDKCEVAKKEDGHNSFASNINVLLHDKFFLSGGFLSEFAKKKVENVISSLKEYRARLENKDRIKIEEDILSPKDTKQIIDLIGEPVLHKRLLEEYMNIFEPEDRLSTKEKIEELKEQLKKLEDEQ